MTDAIPRSISTSPRARVTSSELSRTVEPSVRRTRLELHARAMHLRMKSETSLYGPPSARLKRPFWPFRMSIMGKAFDIVIGALSTSESSYYCPIFNGRYRDWFYSIFKTIDLILRLLIQCMNKIIFAISAQLRIL